MSWNISCRLRRSKVNRDLGIGISKREIKNTSYFQALANQRKRKLKIGALQGPEGEVTQNKAMIEIATNFYKNL